jgi:hypothetical protein
MVFFRVNLISPNTFNQIIVKYFLTTKIFDVFSLSSRLGYISKSIDTDASNVSSIYAIDQVRAVFH